MIQDVNKINNKLLIYGPKYVGHPKNHILLHKDNSSLERQIKVTKTI